MQLEEAITVKQKFCALPAFQKQHTSTTNQ
jgi:hypothetical protein